MREDLQHLAISPSGFIFDPTTGATFTANETARQLLEGLRDGLDLAGLVELVEEHFEVGEADLFRDVLEFLRVLKDEGLVSRELELTR